MLGNLLDNVSLILSHRLKDESQAQFLVVILCRISVWLPFELLLKRCKGVYLNADKIVLVKQLVSKEHSRLDVVQRDDHPNFFARSEFTKHFLPLLAF